MIGVTIASPKFRSLAQKAQEKFEDATGVQSVLFSSPLEKNYLLKLDLHKLFKGQTVVYFDADLWFIKKYDLSELDNREEFLAVKDPGIYDPLAFPAPDSKLLGIDLSIYFNSGLFVWNDRHREVFIKALEIYRKNFTRLKDFGEQSCLNAAAQQVSSVSLLPHKFNYFPVIWKDNPLAQGEEDPVAIHAAGIPLRQKQRALEYFETKHSRIFE